MTIKDIIKKQINQVLKEKYSLENVLFQVEYPPKAGLGDYACNAAMIAAKQLKQKPMDIGEEIIQGLGEFPKLFDKIDLAKPGFINFYLAEEFLQKSLEEILKKKEKFGRLRAEKKLKIQIEFISANPTGPLTLANGRGGFSGDVLANVLELAGHQVQREFYVNDYGNQIRILGHSILKDGQAQYGGEYIDELAKELAKEKNIGQQDVEQVGMWAAKRILEKHIKPAVAKMGIKFDNWFSEKELHLSGCVDKVLAYLKDKNLVFEKDGAVWLKVTDGEVNDDKDRVLVKSNGDKTYFLADIAYHWDKFHKRKFDKVINLWGADHHGYVPRLKSAVAALGYAGQLEILLMQMVRLIKDGKELRMSKRRGVYVLLADLIDEVGLDVARFFFLMRANHKAMDFDLNLAKKKSSQNPVFYVQYAYARICSILKKIHNTFQFGRQTRGRIQKGNLGKLHISERELIRELVKWPEIVAEAAQTYEVHKIAFYAIALADKFHDFYENCQVIQGNQVIESRWQIIQATQQVLQNVLSCLGVNAPEKM